MVKRKRRPAVDPLDALDAPEPVSKSKRIWREVAPSKPIADGFHTYKADPLDHAETDIRAYEHVKPLLELVAKRLSKPISKLAIWDPYYCKGAMVGRLGNLGFDTVHNKNEDFYAVIDSGKLPVHDVLISSPPYSGDHLERCLRFCHANKKKSWCLLLPNWVESRPYFKEVLGEEYDRVFYMSPINRYTYWMPLDLVKGRSQPEWVGQDGGTSPYHSSWFIYLPRHFPQKKMFATLERLAPARSGEWVLAHTMKAARWKVKRTNELQPQPQPIAESDGLESEMVSAPSGKKGKRAMVSVPSGKTGKKKKKKKSGSGQSAMVGKVECREGTITFE